MSLSKIEQRIDEAVKKTQLAREVASKRDRREEEVVEAVRELREAIGDKRKHRKHLDAIKDAEQRERIADKIDSLEGELNHMVDILDRVERRSKAANEELEHHKDRLEYLRKRRKQIIAEIEANSGPSPNFSWAEFNCNDGTPYPKAAEPAIKDWCEKVGEPTRARYGVVHINSAYRHRAYNAAVGGEPNSVHIYDLHPAAVAVDFTCANGTPAETFAFTAGKADGRGRYATFHHADNRNRIGWPDAVWFG